MNESHVDSVLLLAVPFHQDADLDFEYYLWLNLFMNITSQVMNESHVDSVLLLAVPFHQDADLDFEYHLWLNFIHAYNLCR
jgi:hypothetical protein